VKYRFWRRGGAIIVANVVFSRNSRDVSKPRQGQAALCSCPPLPQPSRSRSHSIRRFSVPVRAGRRVCPARIDIVRVGSARKKARKKKPSSGRVYRRRV